MNKYSQGPTMPDYQFGAGLWLFQQFVDRYATAAYGSPVSTLEAGQRAAVVGDLKVAAINDAFAGDISDAAVREAPGRTGLGAQALTPHLDRREFQQGSWTNPDSALRQKAIALGKPAIAIAPALDAQYVAFWPGRGRLQPAADRRNRALSSLQEEKRHGPC